MQKSNPFEGMGTILIDGEPLNENNLEKARLIVTDGFIRAAYSMRDSGQLTSRLNDSLHQWNYKSPVTGKTYGTP